MYFSSNFPSLLVKTLVPNKRWRKAQASTPKRQISENRFPRYETHTNMRLHILPECFTVLLSLYSRADHSTI